jgi:glycosyltransferase involved in cell wall biosynthesis
MKPTVSVVVIARNEEHTIGDVIRETCALLPKISSRYEIVVNDDASADRTGEILEALKKHNNHIRVYHRKKPIGIAMGLEFLYTCARLDYVFILPGDGQYTVRDLPPMLDKAVNGADIVVGKRIRKQYAADRMTVSYLFNALSWVLFGVDTIDAGSVKVYNRKIFNTFKLLSRGVYNEAERIVRATYAGHRVSSAPAHHYGRSGGKASGAKPALIIEAVTDMFRLWWLLRVRRVSAVTLE